MTMSEQFGDDVLAGPSAGAEEEEVHSVDDEGCW